MVRSQVEDMSSIHTNKSGFEISYMKLKECFGLQAVYQLKNKSQQTSDTQGRGVYFKPSSALRSIDLGIKLTEQLFISYT